MKRYELARAIWYDGTDCECKAHIRRAPDGEWYNADEVDAEIERLEAGHAKLRDENATLRKQWKVLRDWVLDEISLYVDVLDKMKKLEADDV